MFTVLSKGNENNRSNYPHLQVSNNIFHGTVVHGQLLNLSRQPQFANFRFSKLNAYHGVRGGAARYMMKHSWTSNGSSKALAPLWLHERDRPLRNSFGRYRRSPVSLFDNTGKLLDPLLGLCFTRVVRRVCQGHRAILTRTFLYYS